MKRTIIKNLSKRDIIINKIFLMISDFIGLFATLVLILGITLSFLAKANLGLSLIICLITIIFIIAAALLSFFIDHSIGGFKCKKCGEIHKPKFRIEIFTPHIGKDKFLVCPKCKIRSLNEKLIDIEIIEDEIKGEDTE